MIQIELPLPPRELSPNFRQSRVRDKIRRSKAIATYRRECAIAYRHALSTQPSALSPQPSALTLHLDYYNARPKTGDDGRYRPRDADDARMAFKPGQDALIDAGIVPNDTADYVQCGETRIHARQTDHQGRCGVMATLVFQKGENR